MNDTKIPDVFNLTHPSNTMLAIVSGTIGAIGLPANIFLLVLIASEYKKRKPHDWLFFTIALGDCMLCLNNVVLEAPFVIDHDRVECKIAGAIEYIFGAFSFFSPPLVAYNRYLSLYDNQKYKRIFTNRNVALASGSTFLFTVTVWTPFIFSGNIGQDDLGLCGVRMVQTYLKVVTFCLSICIAVSYTLLLYFSYKVIVKIRNHKKDATQRSRLQSRLINESREIITVMLIISSIPLFTQIPGAIVKVLNSILPPFDPWIPRAIVAPFPTASAVNAFVTLYIVKEYRKKAISIWKKQSAKVSTTPAASTGSNGTKPLATDPARKVEIAHS